MATEAESVALIAKLGEPVRTEVVPCITTQWNFPHPPDRPWVGDDGCCSICGAKVAWERVGPEHPNLYSRIAMPHTRTMRWFAVDADELVELYKASDW